MLFLATTIWSSAATCVGTAHAATSSGISGSGPFSRYIRKRKLDPLKTYVPVVLAAREQLQEAGDIMGSDAAAARGLLRTGAFGGLRDNVRALGEYAAAGPAGTAGAASLVQGFFMALDSLDLLLYAAVRDSTPVEQADASDKLAAAVRQLDDLIATVPADVLAQSQKVLEQVSGGSRAASPAPAPAGGDLDSSVTELLPL